jgi:hypothetical protein
MNDYLIEFSDIENYTLKEFLDHIDNINGLSLKELKVSDLSYYNKKPIWPGEGVYLFREGKEILYVGKVSSMSFTERIAKHLDLRPFAWFNRLLKIICQKKFNKEISKENLIETSKYAFDNLNLILINFKKRDKINSIEKLLRASTNTLNKFKTVRVKNNDLIINNYKS